MFESALKAARHYGITVTAVYKCLNQTLISTHGLQFMAESGEPPRPKMQKPRRVVANDLQNMRFGKLLVTKRSSITPAGKVKWACVCDCGKTTTAQTTHLLDGRRISCGCSKLDKTRFRIPAEQQAANELFRNYKKGASSRGYAFALTIKQFSELVFGKCFYCGCKGFGVRNIKYRYNNEDIRVTVIHNGIDRMDNNLGYVTENCVSCCVVCNRAKMRLSFDEFVVYLNNLVSYRTETKNSRQTQSTNVQ